MKNTKLKHNTIIDANHNRRGAFPCAPEKIRSKLNANPVGAGLVPAQNEKGITLIALIITIIVMLILVGVTINVALNGGLFKKAEKATNDTKLALEKEELLSATVAAYDYNSNGVNADELDKTVKSLGYKVMGTTGNKMTVQAPSGKEYTIDLESSKVEEKPGGNTGDNPEPELKTEYTFTIGELVQRGLLGTDRNG